MNLLIIGNGFDIAHGLPTRYTDFLSYCKDYDPVNPVSQLEILNDEFYNIVKDNLWLKYFWITSNIEKSKTWVDLEKEILQLIHDLDNANPLISTSYYFGCLNEVTLELSSDLFIINAFFSLFCDSCEDNKKYVISDKRLYNIDAIIEYMYMELRDFARAFEIYCLKVNRICSNELLLEKIIDRLDCEKIIIPNEMKILNWMKTKYFDFVINFNYTNTYERTYEKEGTKYCYIHGKAQEKKEKTNIVFGIPDDLLCGEESFNFKWVKFKKYFQRIFYKTNTEYKNWFNLEKDFLDVYIMGHSLDESDYDILYEIFNNRNSRITIFYYSSGDFEEKVKKVIHLLAYKGDNGRDEFIRRTQGEDSTIRFVDQYRDEY